MNLGAAMNQVGFCCFCIESLLNSRYAWMIDYKAEIYKGYLQLDHLRI